ncbi:MAG: pyridoxamine 5'-phosphate oxidase family protein [Pseudomonadales bacterium]
MILEPAAQYGTWTGTDIVRFLQEVRVPMRLSVTGPKGPVIVPVWFEYHSDSLWCCSPDDSFLIDALRAHPQIAFDISTNDLPYQGIRGRGTAQCTATSGHAELEKLAKRYLTDLDNDLARWLLGRDDAEAVVQITIDWLSSWDFSGRMNGLRPIAERYPDTRL